MARVIFLSSPQLVFQSCVLLSVRLVFAPLGWFPFCECHPSSPDGKVPRSCYHRLAGMVSVAAFCPPSTSPREAAPAEARGVGERHLSSFRGARSRSPAWHRPLPGNGQLVLFSSYLIFFETQRWRG